MRFVAICYDTIQSEATITNENCIVSVDQEQSQEFLTAKPQGLIWPDKFTIILNGGVNRDNGNIEYYLGIT